MSLCGGHLSFVPTICKIRVIKELCSAELLAFNNGYFGNNSLQGEDNLWGETMCDPYLGAF